MNCKYFLLKCGIFAYLLLSTVACGDVLFKQQNKGETVLATVGNRSLLLSDLEGMMPKTPSDSTLFVNAYTESWIKDALLLQEAEVNAPKDLNIDQLVREYRSTLLLHNYEELLAQQQLDTVINETELLAYYENNKSQYQLENSIIRCYFIKLPKKAPNSNKVRAWWEAKDKQKLISYCNTYAESYLLEDSIWYNVEQIAAEFPKGTLPANNISTQKEVVLEEGDFQYFLRVLASKSQKENAPVEYVRERAIKSILHDRKTKLLYQKKEELYENAIKKNIVKMFSQ